MIPSDLGQNSFNIYRFELQEPHNHEIEDELDVDFEESEDDAETDDEEDDDFSDLRKNYINYLVEIDNENKEDLFLHDY